MLLIKLIVHSLAAALTDAIQRAHKVWKKTNKQGDHFGCSVPLLSVLFFFIIEYSVLKVLQYNYKGVLEKVSMQRTPQFTDVFFVTVRTQLNAAHAQLNVE